MTQVEVHITKEVLRKTKDCANVGIVHNCAISYAVMNLLGNKCSTFWNQITSDDFKWRIPLPEEAKSFISRFDNSSPDQREALPELSFEISVPDEALEGIDISDVLKESKTLTLVKI